MGVLKLISYLAVVPILGVAAVLYYSYLYVQLQLLEESTITSTRMTLSLIGFNFIFIWWLLSYISLLFVDPGDVPHRETIADEVDEKQVIPIDFSEYCIELKTSAGSSTRKRYCSKCRNYKPDRAHHCSVCGKCVLRMDHHCPWILHCVGLRNHRLFVQFCGLSALGSIYSALTTADVFVSSITKTSFAALSWQLLIVFIIGVLQGITTLGFTAHHLYLIYGNQTTIELYEKDGFQFPERAEFAQLHPYDLGWKRNFLQVFGSYKLYWLVPIPTLERHRHELADGIRWELRLDVIEWLNAHAHNHKRDQHQQAGLMDMV